MAAQGTSETIAALTLYGSLRRKQSFPQAGATSGFGHKQPPDYADNRIGK